MHSVSVALSLYYPPVHLSCSVCARILMKLGLYRLQSRGLQAYLWSSIWCHFMSFCCSSHCPVNSKQEHYTSLFNASGNLKPTWLLSLVQCWTFKIVMHDRHHSYHSYQECHRPSWFPTVLRGVQSQQLFQSRQSVHIMSPTTHWPVLWCYGGWIFDLLCSCSFEFQLVPYWVHGLLRLILGSLSNEDAAAEDDPW